MSEPVVFISHFMVKEGKLADLRHLERRSSVNSMTTSHGPSPISCT